MSSIFQANTLADMLLLQDQPTIYNAALTIAQTLGLQVSSWQAGDPTRSLFFIEASLLELLEPIAVGFIQSGFLDYAQGEWLSITAKQVFNVDVPAATFATTSVTLTNTGGGVYIIAPGDITLKNTTTGATYHNTTGGTLTSGPGTTLSITVVADVAGTTGGNADATKIDQLVTTLLGVTCFNPVAAVGQDAQPAATTIQQCRNKLGSLSPNGPAQAYAYVALNQTLTGVQTVSRVRVYPSSQVGAFPIYVAGPGGAIPSGDVTAVQAAIAQWAAPLGFTPNVVNANNVSVPVTYTLWIYAGGFPGQTTAQIQATVGAAVSAALTSFFAARPIGGDIIPPATTGTLYLNEITAVIGSVFPGQTFRVLVSSPTGDTALGNGDVAVLGAVTGTINPIAGP